MILVALSSNRLVRVFRGLSCALSGTRSSSELNLPQGMPHLRTNIRPVRAARSLMRCLPPLGLGTSSGNSGNITSQSSSVTSL